MHGAIIFSFLNKIKYNLFFVFPGDQVEHAHDNPVDEITLGECDMTATMTLDEMSSEKPVTSKRMNLEIDKEPEVKCEEEKDSQLEGKRTKKKEVKKEKAKRENMQSKNVYCTVNVLHKQKGGLVFVHVLVCFHVCTCKAKTHFNK